MPRLRSIIAVGLAFAAVLGHASAGSPKLKVPKKVKAALGKTKTFKVKFGANDELSISPLPLPGGMSFDESTRKISFTPSLDDVGKTHVITFTSSNGTKTKTKKTKVKVTSKPLDGKTKLSGKVRSAENKKKKIKGVEVRLPEFGLTVKTNNKGKFKFKDVPEGVTTIEVDGMKKGFAFVAESLPLVLEHPVYPGQNNVIHRPIFIPKLGAEDGMVDPTATSIIEDTALGVCLTVKPNSARLPDGTLYEGPLFLVEVDQDLTPAALPSNLGPGMVIAIQGAMLTFNPPAEIEFPNFDDLQSGSSVDIWSINPATGVFEIAGTGTVFGDKIFSDGGVVSAASWHFPLTTAPSGTSNSSDNDGDNVDPCGQANGNVGSDASLKTGSLRITHSTAPYVSLDSPRSVTLAYTSAAANPNPILAVELLLGGNASTPDFFSSSLTVAGVALATKLYTGVASGSTLHKYPLPAGNIPTGLYPFQMDVTSHYPASTVTGCIADTILVNNQVTSPVGAGWEISGVQRLHFPANSNRVVLTDGTGAVKAFTPQDPTAQGVKTELAFALDGSGSISNSDWTLQKQGIANAVNNPSIVPPDGSVAVAIVQFVSSAQIEIPLTIVDSQATAQQLANDILAIPQENGGTSIDAGIDVSVQAIGAGTPGARQVICISTDGQSNEQAAFDSATAALAQGIDEIDTIGVGSGVDAEFLEELAQLGGGFFVSVGNFQQFAESIALKLKLVLGGAPLGEFSAIFKESDGTFSRVGKDGTRDIFSQSGLHTARIDRNDNATTFSYDQNGRLTAITDPLGKSTTFAYSNNLLSTITDPTGRVTRLTHDSKGNLIEIENPDGSTRKFDYDSDHLLVKQTDPRGNETTYVYGPFARFEHSELPDGSTRAVVASQPIGVVDPAATSPTNLGPATSPGQFPALLIDGNNQTTQVITNQLGSPTAIVDALGRSWSIERNSNGLPTEIQFPNGAITTILWDLLGNPLTVTRKGTTASTSDDRQESFAYNEFSQVTSFTDARGNTTTLDYDSEGNLTRVTDPAGTVTELHYDEAGQGISGISGLLTSIVEAVGQPEERTTRFFYDPATGNLSRTEDPEGRVFLTAYGADGRPSSATLQGDDGPGAGDQTTTFLYDAFGRPEVITDALGGVTQFQYDAAGNLTSVSLPGGGNISYDYDALDRLVTRTDAVGAMDSFTYDGDGNLTSQTTRNGEVISFAYDEAGRIVSKTYPDPDGAGDLTISYGYDANGNGFVTDDNDLLSFAGTNDSSIVAFYNGFDEPQTVTATYPLAPGQTSALQTTLGYEYDDNGNVTKLVANSGALASVNYAYDPLNRLDTLTGGVVGLTATFDHDRLSRRTLVSRQAGGKTFTSSYAYSAADDLLNLTNRFDPAGSNQVVSSFDYDYDPLGRRAARTANRPAFGMPAVQDGYGYDPLDRLTAATHTDTIDESYTYDAVGNRYPTTWVYDAANRLMDDGTYTYQYDPSGKLIDKTSKVDVLDSTSYTYDALGRLVRVGLPDGSIVRYGYDGFDRRVQRVVTPPVGPETHTTFVYDREDVLAEYTGVGSSQSLAVTYSHGPGVDEPLARRFVGAGSPELFHADGLGSVTDITTTGGAAVAAYRYDSFGNLIATTGSSLQGYGYTAREWDAEIGLYYYRARYYDPQVGRFVEEDPIGLLGGTNVYAYAVNNPAFLTDPSGLDIAVCYYPDAGPFGHVGIAVGTMNSSPVQTVGFRPQGDVGIGTGLGLALGKSVPGVVSADTGDRQCQVFQTTKAQDKIAQQAIGDRQNNPGSYNLYSRQCTGFVGDVLNQAGIPDVPDAIRPAEFYGGLDADAFNQTQQQQGTQQE